MSEKSIQRVRRDISNTHIWQKTQKQNKELLQTLINNRSPSRRVGKRRFPCGQSIPKTVLTSVIIRVKQIKTHQSGSNLNTENTRWSWAWEGVAGEREIGTTTLENLWGFYHSWNRVHFLGQYLTSGKCAKTTHIFVQWKIVIHVLITKQSSPNLEINRRFTWTSAFCSVDTGDIFINEKEWTLQ